MHTITTSSLGGGALLLSGLLVLTTVFSACPEPVAVNCGGVLVCPEGTVCDLQGAAPQCLMPDQRGVCDGLADGASCVYSEAVPDVLYACIAGVCQTSCGDGVRQGEEVCDGFDIGAATCDARFYQGRPTCQEDCLAVDFGTCLGECGDGVVQADFGEQCEPGTGLTETCPFEDGTVACTDCRLDFSGCGTCGNGVIDPGEGCDDNAGSPIFLPGEDCQSLGYYMGARQCQGCNPVPAEDTCAQRCGDNTINGDEQCDGGDLGGRTCQDYGYYEAGELGCVDCRWDDTPCLPLPRCGDDIKQAQEACDGGDLGDLTCASFKYHGGTLSCGDGCTPIDSECSEFCGDGILNGPELCDGDSFGPDGGLGLCQSKGYYSGTPSCVQPVLETAAPQDLAGCITFQADGDGQCQEYCGDGIRNGNEVCDGEEFGGLECQSFGFYTGQLSCLGNVATEAPAEDNQCSQIDTSGCSEFCGDGIRNGNEVCDGADFGGASCLLFGASGGHLVCDRFCQTSIELCFYDGLRQEVSPIVNNLNAVAMVDASTAYAVGVSGKIVRYDGEAWVEIDTAGPDVNTALRSVWAEGAGVAEDTGWIVGVDIVATFAGDTVTPVDNAQLPTEVQGGAVWRSVIGFGNGEALVGGDEGHLLHYDGSSWTHYQHPAMADADIYGVIRTESGTVYTVGEGGLARVDLVTEQWTLLGGDPGDEPRAALTPDDGATWYVAGNNGYFGIWTDSNGDDLLEQVHVFSEFAGGPLLESLAMTGDGLIVAAGHDSFIAYDGVTATEVNVPKGMDLAAVTAHPNTKTAIVVADKGRIARWFGEGWQDMPSVIEDGQAAATDLAGLGPGQLFASHGNGNGVSSLVDGQWDYDADTSGISYRAVWGLDDALWAVGEAGAVSRKVGAGSWTPVDIGVTDDLRGIFGLRDGADVHVWILGDKQVIHSSDNGANWVAETLSTASNEELFGVWAASPEDVFVAARQGMWWRLGGDTEWSFVGTGPRPVAVWGTAASNVFAVGNNGLVMRFDGAQWTTLPAPTNAEFFAMDGRSPFDVFAGGQGGTMLHYDGSTWAPMLVSTANTITGIWAHADTVYAAGDKGQFRQFETSLPVLPAGECQSAIPIYCGSSVIGTLGGFDGANHITTYSDSGPGCAGGFNPAKTFDAPDRFYRLDLPGGVDATVTLQPHDHNLALMVAEGDATGCGGMANCIVASDVQGTTTETVVLAPGDTQTAESLYYIAVDGKAANNPDKNYGYTLSITCQKTGL